MGYIKIPYYAKRDARKGLRLRKKASKSKKFGLTSQEASDLGIQSGVQRAYSIINQQYITEEEAKEVARFWSRFRNCRTFKCEGSILLWGGRRWGRELYNKFYKNN